MNPLFALMMLQLRASLRRMTRGLRSVKGGLLFVFGLAVIGLWLLPSVWTAHKLPRTDPLQVRDVAPIIVLATCLLTVLTSGGDKAVVFTPAEVDFLFPAPFTRRQILAYKLIKTAGGALLSACLLSVVFLRHAAGWGQAFTGVLLAMIFIQLFGVALVLVGQSIGERAYTMGRKLLVGIILVVVGMVVLPVLMKGGRPNFIEIGQMMRGNRVGQILLAPLGVFGELFTAANAAGFAKWAALSLLVNLILLWIVFYLDADYLEAAANRSQIIYAKLQRMRKGMMVAPTGKARWSLPPFPYLAGAGPIIWRQCTTATRSARGFILIIILMAVAAGPFIFSIRNDSSLAGGVIGAMAWLTLIVSGWLKFDFRGDLDQMDEVKALPVAPAAIAAGQIVTPAVLMTLCHLLILASVFIVARREEPLLVLAGALSLPFNALLFAIENLIFLYFPSRQAASPADFQGYGRQILMLMVKMGLLLVAAGIVGLFALIAHVLTHSLLVSGAVSLVVLTGIVVAMIPWLAHAFRRFDPAWGI